MLCHCDVISMSSECAFALISAHTTVQISTQQTKDKFIVIKSVFSKVFLKDDIFFPLLFTERFSAAAAAARAEI